MTIIRYTLLGDGPSDRRLTRVIDWVLGTATTASTAGAWADLRFLPQRPRGLRARVQSAVDYYPCDILFIHRDAERDTHASRKAEIAQATDPLDLPQTVHVIPVRMQEAWLLVDEAAIRKAAGNPRGRMRLDLPKVPQLESVSDPKAILTQALRDASGLSGRRLQRLDVGDAASRVADLISTFAPLRQLAAFRAMEQEVAAALSML